MALMNCPECGKEISDKAEFCPSCGYVLVKSELPKIRKSELGAAEKKPSLGKAYIFCGICVIIFGIFTVAIIIGIFAILGGIGLIVAGSGMISGMQKGLCPYCKNEVSVPIREKTFKCPHCKKTSTHNDNYLETIE